MPKRYKVEFFDQNEPIMYYPANFGLEEDPKRIAFGSNIVDADCKQQPYDRNTLSISSALAELLQIPEFIKTLYAFENSDQLLLGPLVGIFSSGFTPFQENPIGERSELFTKLLSVQSSVGVVPFLFGEQHIDWEKGQIEGFFQGNSGWETRNVPFPNVIYDRLPNRKSESTQGSREVKEKLEKDYLIPWYNPGFFSKLDVYEHLFQDEKVAEYLPDTSPFVSYHQVEQMLSRYGHVYVKPINGSLGLGIHQIIYDRQKAAYYCKFHDTENRLLKYPTLEQLMDRVFRNKQLDRMIIQQGIDLIRYQHRPVDFRVHANKDTKGAWKISAIAAKVAGVGSPTTHIKNGGTIKTIDELFADSGLKRQLKEGLETAALEIAVSLEENLNGIIGEIGFDFGIDSDGHIWLFEANSKPGRSIFSHPELKEFDILTRRLSLAYSVYLTDRWLHTPEELFT
ncbi:YheC/YheD family protein [Heyndrickxia acidicola]|uniref:YheC/YheD family protein n=1 Tax=Heyndrickxia acidicola TaxID=209389 RepID=A0ABU6MDB2_9BACI|nr:YheC/YheD family protein [Heyndrickxia acidicola]MED1202413.1 YheC/YheD family protein [Heyndrickxia acidicola]